MRTNVHTAHLPHINVEPPVTEAKTTPPSSPKANPRVSRLMLKGGRVGSDVKLSGAQDGYRCPDMRCNLIHYDKNTEKSSPSLLARMMAREPSPDVVRRYGPTFTYNRVLFLVHFYDIIESIVECTLEFLRKCCIFCQYWSIF